MFVQVSGHPIESSVRRAASPRTGWITAWALVCLALAPARLWAADDAQFISFQVPNEVRAGETFHASVTMSNTGDGPWHDASEGQSDPHVLALSHDPTGDPPNPNITSPSFFDLPQPVVDDGDTVTFEIDVDAPAASGTYDFQVRMHQQTVGPFGDFSFRVQVEVVCPAVEAGEDDAQVVDLRRPEDVLSGEDFEVRVTVRNTGQNCWTPSDPTYVLGADHPGESNPWAAPYRFVLPPGVDYVKPGGEVTFTVPIVASDGQASPLTPGFYPATFQMNRMKGGGLDEGAWFGEVTPTEPRIRVTPEVTRKAEIDAVDFPPRVVTDTESYAVRVTATNTGSATWTAATNIKVGMVGGAPGWFPLRAALPASVAEVRPGQSVTFEYPLTGYGVSASNPVDDFQFRLIKDCLGGPQIDCGWFDGASPVETAVYWDMAEQITVSALDEGLRIGDAAGDDAFIASGFTLIPYYQPLDDQVPEGVRGAQNFSWYTFDEQVVARELREMARLGATAVRFWAPGDLLELDPVDLSNPNDDPTVNELYLDRLLFMLEHVRANGLRAIVGLPGPGGYWALLKQACDAGELTCGPLFGAQSRAIFDAETRHFLMQRTAKLFEAASLGDRPEILGFNLWTELGIGGFSERQTVAGAAWNQYLDEKYLRHGVDPCATWGYSGQMSSQLAAACAGTAAEFPGPQGVEMCCDREGEGCELDPWEGDWKLYAQDYRSFVDLSAMQAFEQALDGVGTIPGLRQLAGSTLISSGIASFHREQGRERARCQNGGYLIDPRVTHSMMDYVSIDSYPWNDLSEPYDPDELGADRYDMLRLGLEYARGTLPVILEETGYNTCNTQVAETSMPRQPNPLGDCQTRDEVQKDVYTRAANVVRQIELDGGLYFTYRDRRDRAVFGTVRLDGSRKPVYDQLEDDLATVVDRSAKAFHVGTLDVDPCSDVLIWPAILEQLGVYQGQQVPRPGRVTVNVLRPVGDDCQSP